MSEDNSLDRIKFASELISNLASAGLSLGEVAATLESSANLLDGLKEAGYTYDHVAQMVEDNDPELKTAMEKCSSVFDGVAAQLLGMGGAGLALAGAGGLYGTSVLGKSIGRSMAAGTEKGPDYLEEVKHRELMDVLRDNAANLRRRKALLDEQEGR